MRINETPVLHIRFEGRSFDIPFSDLDVGSISSDTEIKRALSGYLNIAGSETSSLRDRPA